MIGALARAEATAERRAAAVRERVAVAAGQVPGVAAAVEGDGVVLSGRGLTRRTVTDPRLHDLGEWGR